MSPTKISKRIVSDRLDWIDKMLAEISKLPLTGYEDFARDSRNIWAAESCLRRCLEALMDLGRHILAKGFAMGVSEYKEIAAGLSDSGVLTKPEGAGFRILAGYRNRMVHFYHEISNEELYEICSSQLSDIRSISAALRKWIKNNPSIMDEIL